MLTAPHLSPLHYWSSRQLFSGASPASPSPISSPGVSQLTPHPTPQCLSFHSVHSLPLHPPVSSSALLRPSPDLYPADELHIDYPRDYLRLWGHDRTAIEFRAQDAQPHNLLLYTAALQGQAQQSRPVPQEGRAKPPLHFADSQLPNPFPTFIGPGFLPALGAQLWPSSHFDQRGEPTGLPRALQRRLRGLLARPLPRTPRRCRLPEDFDFEPDLMVRLALSMAGSVDVAQPD